MYSQERVFSLKTGLHGDLSLEGERGEEENDEVRDLAQAL